MADQHVRGAESLNRKLSAIQNQMDAITKAMGKEIRRVRNAAVLLCPVNHGELRQSIRTDVKQEKTLVRGICYTNMQHMWNLVPAPKVRQIMMGYPQMYSLPMYQRAGGSLEMISHQLMQISIIGQRVRARMARCFITPKARQLSHTCIRHSR